VLHTQITFSNRALIGIILCAFISGGAILGGTLDTEEQESWIKKYKRQENVPDPEKTLLNKDPEPEITKDFVSLFNGKDLSGWTPKGGHCTFEVKDECIVGTCVKGSPSTYLSTEKNDYTDFIFTCDMKWEEDGNSGVMFRAKERKGKNGNVTVFGPQAEMEGLNKGRGWSGGIYGQSCGGYFYPLWLVEHREARKALKEGWNRLTISAKGNVVKTWLNGVPAAHWVDDGSYPKGYFGLQIHSGSQGKVLWKNILLKETQAK
jgi:hypothetical protein